MKLKTVMTLGLLLGLALNLRAEALPESYVAFEKMAEDLVAPLVPLLEPGKSILDLHGPASDHGELADRLESVARPGLLLALWLQMEPLPEDQRGHDFTREAVAGWYREALVLGTDPASGQYWGELLNYHQHGVEMAVMTISLTVARDWIWDPLSQAEKDQVAEWLGGMRGSARYWNNHLYFGILVIEFLRAEGYGRPGDAEAVAFMFEQLEAMHMGNGWFKDGINETYDHYNAYAFHTYGLWWALQYGDTDPSRATRWMNWARSFVQDYAHFYAASGEHLPYGRSITYRFNGLGVFGLAARLNLGVLPDGEMRRLCRKNLEFFLSHPIGQDQGCLSIGWTDEFHGIAEPYSCAGSPYWAAKGLMMLTIPPTHPFWTDAELPYPAERGDFVRVIPAPRFILRGIGGQVELLNGGSQVSRGNAERYGPWKWSKLSYRTGHGFLVGDSLDAYPVDAVLTVERQSTGQRMGRHSTIPIITEADHMAYLYCLGTRDNGFNLPVRTDIFWKGPWLLVLHRVDSGEAVCYRQGGLALGLPSPDAGSESTGPGFALASNGELSSFVQGLHGLGSPEVRRLEAGQPRRQLLAPYDATPVMQSGFVSGRQILAVVIGSGPNEEQWEPWTLVEADQGHWHLAHPVTGDWEIEDPALPAL